MVNFGSDESLKVPVNDVKKRGIMEKRDLVNVNISNFHMDTDHDIDDLGRIRASLKSLFMELGEHIKRFYSDSKYQDIKLLITNGNNIEKLETAYEQLDAIIYDVIDTNREPLL